MARTGQDSDARRNAGAEPVVGMHQAPTALPPASILAVVDHPAVRDLLTELAVEEGYGLYCADGALEALAVLGRERPGVVVVEVEMPNARGLRFLDIFCQLEPRADILCVALARQSTTALPETVKVLSTSDLSRLQESLMAILAQRFGGGPL